MACTGIEYCKLSFAETRKRSQVLVPELEKRLEDINAQLDVPITVNINGCPNSCARIQVADIGFKGQMVDDGDGTRSRASRCTWAAAWAWTAGSAASCASTRCCPAELGDYIERVVRNFVKQREDGERFATWAVRADEADLRGERDMMQTERDDLIRSWPSAARPSWPTRAAEELLRWTDETLRRRTTSWRPTCRTAVLVDMAAKVRPGVDVLFLDTGYHFAETIGTRDAVEAVYDVNVVNVTPENSVAKQDELFGKDLFARDAAASAAGCARSSRWARRCAATPRG